MSGGSFFVSFLQTLILLLLLVDLIMRTHDRWQAYRQEITRERRELKAAVEGTVVIPEVEAREPQMGDMDDIKTVLVKAKEVENATDKRK